MIQRWNFVFYRQKEEYQNLNENFLNQEEEYATEHSKTECEQERKNERSKL